MIKTPKVALLQVPTTLPDEAVALATTVGETAPLPYTVWFTDQNPNFALFQHPVG